MAEIATYICSNYQCRLTLRLSRNFPVHKDGELIRKRSDTFCLTCKKITEYDESHECTECGKGVEAEQLGNACPRCNAGVMHMPRLSIY